MFLTKLGPNCFRRSTLRRFGLPATHVFDDWTKLAACERIADAVVIATQDHMHVEPAVVCSVATWR